VKWAWSVSLFPATEGTILSTQRVVVDAGDDMLAVTRAFKAKRITKVRHLCLTTSIEFPKASIKSVVWTLICTEGT